MGILILSPRLTGAEFETVRHISLSYDTTINPPFSIIPYKSLKRPRVGLTLSGGGIRGVAQIGVLSVLEKEQIPIDYIVGTSIGGVVGALYASGYAPEEIMDIARSTEWGSVLSDSPQRSSMFLGEKQKRGRSIVQIRLQQFKPVIPEAFTPGQRISNLFTEWILNSYYRATDFNELYVPLNIITTDMLSGKKVTLKNGDLAQAMRSTIAIPLLFTPVELDSFMLVDGGVVDNIPVDETRTVADLVIAIDTTSPLRRPSQLDAPWEIADQITTIMQQERDAQQLENADVVIGFDDMQVISTDYDAIEILFEQGKRRAYAQLDSIKALLSSCYTVANDSIYPIQRIEVSGADPSYVHRFIDPLKTTYSCEDIRSILRRIYSFGDVQEVSATILKDHQNYILRFYLTMNPVLKDIVFYGNSQFPSDSLKQFFADRLNRPINHHKTRDVLKHIIQHHRQHGYSLTSIDRINFNERDLTAHIYLSEGIINTINIKGLDKTRRFVIDRELDLHRGEIFRFERAKSGLENIFATGLFSSVHLNVQSNSSLHDLDFHVSEKPSQVVRLGARYDTERTAKVFAEFSDENILGTANDLTLHVQYGGRDFKAYADYRADRLFKSYLTSQINLHHRKSDHDAYVNLEPTGEYQRRASGLNINLGRQISRFGTLSGHLRFEEIQLQGLSGHGYDTGTSNINTFGMQTVIDTRDQVAFPMEGKYHIFFYELSSGLVLGADKSFFKFRNQLATFTTFGKRHTVCPKLIWGTSDATTPYSEQFRLGGQESFYGLREGQLWGRHIILASLEYRYLVPKLWAFDTFFSMRYDLGSAWNDVEAIKTNDFVGGVGAALGLKTPIGPFSFAYGATNRGHQKFYFSAGFEF